MEPPVEYRKRSRVMNNSEARFFYLLKNALTDDFHIFPKMRIADILETVHGEGYYVRRNKVLPKHIDFLICNELFKPLLGIEIDGSSHRTQKRVDRDREVNKIFEDVGLILKRVVVGSSFEKEIAEIKDLLTR